MNYPKNDLGQHVPRQNIEPNRTRRWPSLYSWVVVTVAGVALAAVFSLAYLGLHHSGASTTSHKLNLRPAATKVVAPQPVAPSLKPAEKIAKQLGGTDIVGSSKSEMQSLNTGDSAGIVADYATFQMNGTKYIVLLFTGPTTKSVAELGFAEAGMGDAAYSGPTWDVYTKAQWDKAKSAANA